MLFIGASLPVYTHVLNSPVARVFDVVRSASTEKAAFLVLPQPFVPAERRPNEDKTFVGCTEQGGWYALSEMSYPYVSERASPADCYRRKPKLSKLPQIEKEKVLIGIHSTQYYSSSIGPASIWGQQQPLLIAAPTEPDYLKPKTSESTSENVLPLSTATAIKRLGIGKTWSVAFAIPFLLGCLFYWFEGPKLMKLNLDIIRKDTAISVPRVGMKALDQIQDKLPLPSNPAITNSFPERRLGSTEGQLPEHNDENSPAVVEEIAPEPVKMDEDVRGPDETPDVRENPVIVEKDADVPLPNPESEQQTEAQPQAPPQSQSRSQLQPPAEAEPQTKTQPPPTQEPVPIETKTVRFEEERPQAPQPTESAEDTEAPLTPTVPAPKKRKAHRGQRGGKKKKGSKAQQAEENDEIGRIVDRAKDIQQSTLALEPDVKVLNESGDIDSSVIRIDNLEVHQNPQNTLGLGSQGTVVFKGKFEGRAVAVKRMLRTFFDVAHREVKLLQDSDDHPNVIRYHCMKELDQFLYIALEQCRASLCDVMIEPRHNDLRRLLDPQQVLKQICAGVNHLHQMKIVHRDLKPQNILVSEPKRFPRDPTKIQHPRILISDFGLCKQLEANQSSFRATTAHAAGTSGWRAPELLMDDGSMDMRPFSSSALSETSGGSSTETALFDGVSNRRATRAIDVFSMGCVFFFVLTQGGHPFGAMKYSREMNVITGSNDLSPLEALGDTGYLAKDLIQKMIQRHPKSRYVHVSKK